MDIFQAIQFVVVVKSWEEITAESIRNCWNHPKILPNTNRMEVDLTGDCTSSALKMYDGFCYNKKTQVNR